MTTNNDFKKPKFLKREGKKTEKNMDFKFGYEKWLFATRAEWRASSDTAPGGLRREDRALPPSRLHIQMLFPKT